MLPYATRGYVFGRLDIIEITHEAQDARMTRHYYLVVTEVILYFCYCLAHYFTLFAFLFDLHDCAATMDFRILATRSICHAMQAHSHLSHHDKHSSHGLAENKIYFQCMSNIIVFLSGPRHIIGIFERRIFAILFLCHYHLFSLPFISSACWLIILP